MLKDLVAPKGAPLGATGCRRPAGALPGLRAAGPPGGGPAPPHPNPHRQGRLNRGGQAQASPAGDRP
jgi:hypothetical protein